MRFLQLRAGAWDFYHHHEHQQVLLSKYNEGLLETLGEGSIVA